MLNEKQITSFRTLVLDYYAANKRDLPWRQTTDPYKIMVSEVMLQQTQVERVIPKYVRWIERFPNITSLAGSTLREVLTYWSGLGYNRRGQNLWKAAQILEKDYSGSFESFINPAAYKKDPLITLPGVGPYTCAAIRAFAFNEPVIMIETNIRTVYIHHFFSQREEKISDQELLPLIEQTLDKDQSRNWYNALMDYGNFIKQTQGNATRKSNSYAKQSQFKGSKRRLRGMIIKHLTSNTIATLSDLLTLDPDEQKRIEVIAQELVEEGLLVFDSQGIYRIE